MKAGFTLIELMIVVLIIGVLAAIAIPNLLSFQARARRAEVKSSLRTAYVTERAFLQAQDRFTPSTVEAGFSVDRGNRFHYVFVDACPVSEVRSAAAPVTAPNQTCIQVDTFKNAGADAAPPTAVTEFVNTASLLLGASGNVDNDPAVDQWSISSESRAAGATSSPTTCRGMAAAAGEPCNDVADL